MHLSMWMIANRLHALEPEVSITSDAPMELRGARNIMIPYCVHIYERNKDVYIQYGEDYIKLHDIEYNYVFNTVQGIFEFYNDWTERLQQAVNEMDFQKMLDECWFFVGNPIILMDNNNRCLAMCSQYGDDEVDKEWEYVAHNQYSSLEFIKKMRKSYPVVDLYRKNRVQLLKKDNIDVYYDTLTVAIYDADLYCGRLNVLEKEREFNYGDIQVIEYILKIIAPTLYMLQSQEQSYLNKSIFRELLSGNTVSENLVHAQFQYLEWKEDDIFQIGVLRLTEDDQGEESRALVSSQIRRNTTNVYVMNMKEEIIVIFNLRFLDKRILADTIDYVLHDKMEYNLGISSPTCGLTHMKLYYEQAQAAIQYGKWLEEDTKKKEFYFYDYALYYMLENKDVPRLYCALHPDVRYLHDVDRANGSGWLDLLKNFFDNECSLVNTAKATFMHRNTLVYRLNKLTEMIHYDWHVTYNRDYMKQSILLLNFYRKRYGEKVDLANMTI